MAEDRQDREGHPVLDAEEHAEQECEPGCEEEEGAAEEFSELVKFTLPGFAGGLIVGVVLDALGLQRNPVGQWLVRTLAGEGESIFEGVFALRQRLRRATSSMAEAYGWGKVLGMVAPWIIDWASRLLGVNVYGVEGFYIPYFYGLSDQIGASISGLVYLRREAGSWRAGLQRYVRHPVMVASLTVILIAPVALFLVRLLGFSPTTQVYTALETIAANLCWVPPVVGWLAERRQQGSRREG